MPELSFARRGFKLDPSSDGERAKFGKVASDGSQIVAVSSSGGGTAPGTVNTAQNGITTDQTLVPATPNLRILGFTCRESAVTADIAQIIIRHGVVSGGNSTGDEIAYITLGALQSIPGMWYGERGLSVPSGISVDVLSGTVDINVFTVVEATA